MADGESCHCALPHNTDHFRKTGEDEEMIDRHIELCLRVHDLLEKFGPALLTWG
jgi:hypothetical protein